MLPQIQRFLCPETEIACSERKETETGQRKKRDRKTKIHPQNENKTAKATKNKPKSFLHRDVRRKKLRESESG